MMKFLPALVLAVTAAASAAAGAATYGSDQERRDQNREEALSKWRADHRDLASSGSGMNRKSTVREKAHRGANSVRGFTHRQAEKARRFSERQDRKYGKQHAPINTSPEGGGK